MEVMPNGSNTQLFDVVSKKKKLVSISHMLRDCCITNYRGNECFSRNCGKCI